MTTMQAARSAYYQANDFGDDGGASNKWVVFKLGPLPFVIPNTKARMEAVAYHDLHHVLTGFQTNWQGEFEISAFEVAVGCHNKWVAWVLNLAGMAIGAVLIPTRVWKAFVRGRQAAGLYAKKDLSPYLARDVEDVRAELGLDREPAPATSQDRIAYAGYWALGVTLYAFAWIATLAPLAALWWKFA